MAVLPASRRVRAALALLAAALPALGALHAQAQPFEPSLFGELRWRMIGPFRGGRTVAASGVPGNTNVFYMAPNNGGVWKTTDAGRTCGSDLRTRSPPVRSARRRVVVAPRPRGSAAARGSCARPFRRRRRTGRTTADARGRSSASPTDSRSRRSPPTEATGPCVRRGPRPPVRRERDARDLPDEDAGRRGRKSSTDADTGGAAVALDPRNPEPSTPRSGRRGPGRGERRVGGPGTALQVDGRRTTWRAIGRACPASRAAAGASGSDRGVGPEPDLRDRGRAPGGEGRGRHLRVGRRGDVREGERRKAPLGPRLDFAEIKVHPWSKDVVDREHVHVPLGRTAARRSSPCGAPGGDDST